MQWGAAPIAQSVETSLLTTLSNGPRVHGNMAAQQDDNQQTTLTLQNSELR